MKKSTVFLAVATMLASELTLAAIDVTTGLTAAGTAVESQIESGINTGVPIAFTIFGAIAAIGVVMSLIRKGSR